MTSADENKDSCLFSRANWDQSLEGDSLGSLYLCCVTGPLAGNGAQAYNIKLQPPNTSWDLTHTPQE